LNSTQYAQSFIVIVIIVIIIIVIVAVAVVVMSHHPIGYHLK